MDDKEPLTFRTALVKAGLGGLMLRSIVLAFVPWLLWWLLKPSVSFCADGTARPFGSDTPNKDGSWWCYFGVYCKDANSNCKPTWFPHWMTAVVGLLVSVLA